MEDTRNYGLDIYRILCCIGVLTYHIMDDVVGKPGEELAKALYFAASYCVPGFFLLSGYLLGIKEKLPVEYSEEKIAGIIKKLLAWTIFWIVIHFLHTGEIYDLWENFIAGANGRGGILPVAWFLFTYCLLMLLGYPLWHFMKKHPYLFTGMSILWCVLLTFDVGRSLLSTRPQSLWLHLYAGYFCIGMSLSKVINIIPPPLQIA